MFDLWDSIIFEVGGLVTKGYLSETFQNSIILKGSERFLFQKGWGFMMFHNENASVILGLQWGE